MNYVWAAYGVCALVLGGYAIVVVLRVQGVLSDE